MHEREVLYFKRRLKTQAYTKDYTLKSIRRRVDFPLYTADFCALLQEQGSFFLCGDSRYKSRLCFPWFK